MLPRNSASRPFRFAVQARPLDEHDGLVRMARAVEALGYAELYSYDHIGSIDPFVPLVVAAEATTNLRIGPLVLNNELHHPALLARTAATVDRLSNGRLVLGMGTGYAENEHDAIGVPLRPPAPRVGRFEESLVALRSLLDTGRAEFEGGHHSLHIDDLGVRPVQDHVPFLVGGYGRRVVRIAAEHADIYQFTGLTHADDGRPSAGGFALDLVRRRAEWLSEDAVKAGDRDHEIERSALVQATDIAPDAADRIAAAADRFGVDPAVIEQTPFVLIGSLQQMIDKLERLRADVGISHYVIRDPDGVGPLVEALAGR